MLEEDEEEENEEDEEDEGDEDEEEEEEEEVYWILLTPGRHSLWCPGGIWQENWNRDPSPFVTGCLPSWCAPHRWYIGVAPPTMIVVVAITRIII